MKALLFAALGLMIAGPALASDRFAPDNPWFRDFEKTCRVGQSGLDPHCQGSLLDSYAAQVHSTRAKVTCDDAAFWRAKDTRHADKTFAVLPWQYGVEALVAEPCVCKRLDS